MLLKLTFSVLLTVALCCCASAQGNLQFNRALYFQMSGSVPAPPSGSPSNHYLGAVDSIVVPAGKVVKIETYRTGYKAANTANIFGNAVAFDYTTGGLMFTMNDIPLTVGQFTNSGQIPDGPIWLPTGTYVFKLSAYSFVGNAQTYQLKAFISAIEFNVVP